MSLLQGMEHCLESVKQAWRVYRVWAAGTKQVLESINSCQCIMLSEQENEKDYILHIELLPPSTIPVISERDLL